MLFALAQFAAAAVLLLTPSRRPVRAVAAFGTASTVMWSVAHIWGLPVAISIWRPEGLSIPDLILPTFEAIAAALLWHAEWGRPRRLPWTWLERPPP